MPWPSPPDYNEAIQNPRHCFNDPELCQGEPARNALGLPWPRSGNNADVYKIIANGKHWAVKCFTREVHGLHERYQAISDHLKQNTLPFMVRFEYIEQGIRIHGQWYPIVKMRWVEGLTLNDLVKEFIDRPQILDRLAQLWLRLAQEMRMAQIVHGDLQHGNVLLVPRKSLVKLRLRLIDYDGMIVPALAQRPSGELGHPNYQHPQRLRDGTCDAETDRFAHLVIYTALRCLVHAGRPLWEKYENGDNMLFRERDFNQPGQSALLHELMETKDPAIAALTGHLLLASKGPLARVPLLQDLVVNGEVSPLTTAERELAGALMAATETDADDIYVAEEAADQRGAPERKPEVATLSRGTGTRLLSAGGSLAAQTTAMAQRLMAWGRERPRWSGRSLWTGIALGVGLVSLATLAGLLARQFTIAMVPPDEPQTPVSPLAAGMPRLAPIGDVTLQVGENQLEVRVVRKGYNGPLTIHLDGLPEGVTCKPVTVPPLRESGVLELKATDEAIETETQVELAIQLVNQVAHTQNLAVRVQRPSIAGLIYPKEVFLLSGERQTIRVQVQRQDYQGPVHLALEGLPASLKFAPVDIPAGQTTAILEVSSTADAKDWAGNIGLTAHVGSIRVWNSSVEAMVVKPTALRLLPIPDVVLGPGESQKIRVGVDRRGYSGPIVVHMEDLPNGVTCKPVTLMGADGLAILELAAGREVAPVDKPIAVAMYLGGKKFTTQTAKLTIGKLLPGQTVSRENVRFFSVDGVLLCGTWYKSSKGKDAPCVLLLHNIGGHRKQEGWDGLAQRFQEKGYAVLSFDFRGHGESTTVEDNFWLHPVNRNGVRGSATAAKETIRLSELTPAYYPILANDIAAARMFLDRLNDEGKCNSANVLLVGAHEGATLGALWLCSECCRYPAINLKPVKLDPNAEGKHVAGAVWLNISPTLADQPVPLLDWLRLTGRDRRVPTTFVRGADDAGAAVVSTPFVQEFRPAPLTEMVIPKTKLTGHALLNQELGTEAAILAFCDQVLKEKPVSAWTSRDVDRRVYYWSISPSANLLIAKQRGEKALHFLPLTALGIR